MRCGKAVLGLGVLGFSIPALAQTPANVLEEGDTIIGVGVVETMDDFNINDAKTWTARVQTDNSNPNADTCLLRSGFVTLLEGLFVANPADSWINTINAAEIDDRGNVALVLGIRVPGGGSRAVDAVYWNSKLLARNTGVLTSPAVGTGTTYDTFEGVKISDNNMVLAIGQILNPSVGTGSSKEHALIRYTLDSVGNVVDTWVVATKGMSIPQLNGATVTTMLLTAPTSYDMNASGDVICFFSTSSAAAVMLNMTEVLAMETGPSPIAGRTWNSFTATAGTVSKVSLNDRGEYVLSGILQGDAATAYLVEKNGQKFVQQGDVLPGLAPLSPTAGIDVGGGAPVIITNTSDVFWRATVTGVANAAYMRNYDPIVIAGHTSVDGKLVTEIVSGGSCFDVSPNGRFFIGGVELDGVGAAALFVDFGLVLDIPGCFGNDGELSVTSGSARVGDHLTFTMDNGHAAPAGARINFSRRQRVPGSDCGVVGPYGEVLISGAHRVATITLPTWSGTGPTSLRVDIPPTSSLIDATFFAQGQFRRPGSPISISLTNALRIEFGAP